MKTKPIISLIIAGILYFGCNSGNEKKPVDSPVKEIGTETKKEVLELNQGEKWPVNEEMKPHILASEMAFNVYRTNKGEDYQALAGVLKEHTDKLISSCTMKGESHEQLHLWLHPHLVLIKDLANAPSPVEADAILGKLEASFISYHTYFQ